MFEVRIHGRGGQGVVTAAELLSMAAFLDGARAQAFPSFGSERTGAPVVAFCRIAGVDIRNREPIVRPDAVLIQDATLLHQVDVFGGLGPDGYLLVNTARTFHDLGVEDVTGRVQTGHSLAVPATELALAHVGRPQPNAAMLGAFAALTGRVSLGSVLAAVRDRFPGVVAEGNVAAATVAFNLAVAGSEGSLPHRMVEGA
jgi:pyruvate ferredoxin oxidoreductase gamma subunit